MLAVTATVLHTSLFAAELGISMDEVAVVKIESAFDAENRPIRKMYCGSMSFKNRARTLPKMVERIVRIAANHRDEPGIVHTHSHYLAGQLVDELRAKMAGRVVEKLPSGTDRTFVIQQFLSGALGPNAILVGPSMMAVSYTHLTLPTICSV